MSDDPSGQAVRCWRAWRTVKEMCKDRGYSVADEDTEISLDAFRDRFCDADGSVNRGRLSFAQNPTPEMVEKHSMPSKEDPSILEPPDSEKLGSIYVEFSAKDKIGVADIKKFTQTVRDNNFHTGIFITQESKVTAHAAKIIPVALPTVIEIFPEEDLLVNITKHELVPKHVMLSETEKRALLHRYRVKDTQLPRIQASDPIAKYLGLRRGNVVKIIRRSETAGRYASYRSCI